MHLYSKKQFFRGGSGVYFRSYATVSVSKAVSLVIYNNNQLDKGDLGILYIVLKV